jgi:hypothetical protein
MNLPTIALSLCFIASAPAQDMRQFLDAIRQVETGGEPNGGRDSTGDNGRSIGPYQIGLAYWKDSRVSGQWADVRDRTYAERVMMAYWKRYAPAALASNDFETLARVHNGGVRGASKNATIPYWRKVQAAMKK